nr:hypothetical protein [Enterobacter roggenkampii]
MNNAAAPSTKLADEAKAQQDITTLRFLRDMDKEQQQDGLLLKTLADELHNAQQAGLCPEQTDVTCSTLWRCSNH